MKRLQKPAPGSRDPGMRSEPMAENIVLTSRGREWNCMGDDEIVAFAFRFVEEMGIKNRRGLAGTDSGLCSVLRKRGLLDRIVFEKPKRTWGTDEEVLAFARRLIEEKGSISSHALENVDRGLYQVLVKRRLLGAISLEKLRGRSWGADQEVLEFARKLIDEKGIQSTRGLEAADSGLFQALKRRGLLRSTGLRMRPKPRTWGTDEEIISRAREIIEKRGIMGRHTLEDVDNGLYQALLKRNLLDTVFPVIAPLHKKEAVLGIIEAVGRFGDPE